MAVLFEIFLNIMYVVTPILEILFYFIFFFTNPRE